MKSKFFVIVTIIALVGFVVTLDYGTVWAQQEVLTKEELDEEKWPIPVEFSTDTCCATLFGDAEIVGGGNAPDPQQVLYRDINTPPQVLNLGFDFDHPDYPDGEVDALAHTRDTLFHELVQNRATLLVSFECDPFFIPQPQSGHIAVYQEFPWCWAVPKWSHHDLDPFGMVLDTLELDALEVWGRPFTEQSGWRDANHYSLIGDPGTPKVKVSVFYYDSMTTISTLYVPHSDIVAAVTNPALDTLPNAGHYTGLDEEVDLDALMVWDGNNNHEWDDPDTIIFSIRAAGNWDGGEIVVLPFAGKPNSASYLFCSRRPGQIEHLWNTAFTVADYFQLDPATEEVDAIEVYPYWRQTPALTQWGLIVLVALLIISTVFVLLKRRKVVVRA